VSLDKKIVIVVISAFLLLTLAMGTKSCRRAEGDKAHVKPGMSVAEVFEVTNDWNMSLVHCDEWRNRGSFSAFHSEGTFRISTPYRTLGSRDELIEVVEKEMAQGGNCGIQFTYMGVPRSTFRVDFDKQRKVMDVSDTVGRP
jgi:hypothetical protein